MAAWVSTFKFFAVLSDFWRPHFRVNLLSTSSHVSPFSSLLGPIVFVPFWAMIKTTWSRAPALQPQPRPIKWPHCGIGLEATGLRLWSLVRRGREVDGQKERRRGHDFRTGACCKGELWGKYTWNISMKLFEFVKKRSLGFAFIWRGCDPRANAKQ